MAIIECDASAYKVIVSHVEPKDNGMCESTEWRTFITDNKEYMDEKVIMGAVKGYLTSDCDIVVVMTKDIYDSRDNWEWVETFRKKDFE